MRLAIFLLVTTLLSTPNAESLSFNPICSVASDEDSECLSWRLAVEANNLRGLRREALVPMSCKDYIKNYMVGKQYRRDCKKVAAAAIEYAERVKDAAADGKGVWVFDIDETTLSNMGYYNSSEVEFGTLVGSKEAYEKWVEEGKAEAVPAILDLYNKVLSLKFKTVILTALSDKYKVIREENLRKEGYKDWTELIFRGKSEGGSWYKAGKRTELVNKGYKIVGNVGDQWSDLLGPDAGNRTFKVPNPIYYV